MDYERRKTMKYFNLQMTSSQARSILFSSISHMSESDAEEMKKEYKQIVPEIIKREFRDNNGWMTEDRL